MLYNDISRQSPVQVSFSGDGLSASSVLDDNDIRDMELVRSRRALAYLKDRIGNDGMRQLLANDLNAASEQTEQWLHQSEGRWHSAALIMTAPGPPAAYFHDWFMGNMKQRHEPLFRAGHPDHFLNRPLPSGGAEVIENVGEDDLPWHIFLEFCEAGIELPTTWDPDYPSELSFAALIADRDGRRIGSAMHELRDVDHQLGRALEAKLTIHLPEATPEQLLAGHLRHFAIEFRNWTEMARGGVAALDVDTTKP